MDTDPDVDTDMDEEEEALRSPDTTGNGERSH
jgi:hypothetical protein